MEEQRKIEMLRRFFTVSVAAFEMQHSVSKAFGYLGAKSYMHLLHINAKNEIDKVKPNLEKIDEFLSIMEEIAKENSEPNPNLEKGSS